MVLNSRSPEKSGGFFLLGYFQKRGEGHDVFYIFRMDAGVFVRGVDVHGDLAVQGHGIGTGGEGHIDD